jgi:hypothetical protein
MQIGIAKWRKLTPDPSRPSHDTYASTARHRARVQELRIDMVGQVFGKLTVESPAKGTGHGAAWNCRCECGELVRRSRADLMKSRRQNETPSCKVCRSFAIAARNAERKRAEQVVELRPAVSYCVACFGMSHRRPRNKPCRCGERYAPEHIEPVEVERRSWWQ